MPQPQRLRGHDRDRRAVIAPPGQNVEDDLGRRDIFAARLGAGGLDRGEAVACWKEALELLQQIGSRDADDPAAALARVADS